MAMISPSILSADFSILGQHVRELEEAGVELLHIDVMDGSFVPNISIGLPVINSIRPVSKLPFDVHLMINNPSKYIEDFVKVGADYITVHYEADAHMDRLIDYIKSFNIKAGIAINPSTPVSLLKHLLHKVDLVLVMSVNPGFGGQSFIPYCYDKIQELDLLRKENNYSYYISVDGGINMENCSKVIEKGVDILVSGSTLFKDNKIKENVAKFREQCQK